MLRLAVTRVFFRSPFLFCCLLIGASLPVSAAGSAPGTPFPATGSARIVYTADTLGEVNPCVTCGDTPLGGLARRAALLRSLAAEGDRPLILAGPDEFHSDKEGGPSPRPDGRAAALYAAFGHIPYTAIYLSPAASRDMHANALAPPPAAVPVAEKPVTRFFRAGSLAVACVFLPAGSTPDSGPAPEQILAARQAAMEAARDASCVIAVSPWGIRAESALAPSFGGYFHILLGGGKGIAVPGQPTGDAGSPGPLWARSDRRGRAVSVLDILSLPAPGSPWLEGVNFSSRLVFLESGLPQDEAILGRLRGLER